MENQILCFSTDEEDIMTIGFLSIDLSNEESEDILTICNHDLSNLNEYLPNGSNYMFTGNVDESENSIAMENVDYRTLFTRNKKIINNDSSCGDNDNYYEYKNKNIEKVDEINKYINQIILVDGYSCENVKINENNNSNGGNDEKEEEKVGIIKNIKKISYFYPPKQYALVHLWNDETKSIFELMVDVYKILSILGVEYK